MKSSHPVLGPRYPESFLFPCSLVHNTSRQPSGAAKYNSKKRVTWGWMTRGTGDRGFSGKKQVSAAGLRTQQKTVLLYLSHVQEYRTPELVKGTLYGQVWKMLKTQVTPLMDSPAPGCPRDQPRIVSLNNIYFCYSQGSQGQGWSKSLAVGREDAKTERTRPDGGERNVGPCMAPRPTTCNYLNVRLFHNPKRYILHTSKTKKCAASRKTRKEPSQFG